MGNYMGIKFWKKLGDNVQSIIANFAILYKMTKIRKCLRMRIC